MASQALAEEKAFVYTCHTSIAVGQIRRVPRERWARSASHAGRGGVCLELVSSPCGIEITCLILYVFV